MGGAPDGSYTVAHGLTHEAPPEMLVINKYQFLLVLERTRKRIVPHGEWSLVPAGMFLAIMLAVLTTDFKSAFGLDKAVWEAIAAISAAITGGLTAVLAVWWAVVRLAHPIETPDDVLDGVIKQMAEDRARMAAQLGPPVG